MADTGWLNLTTASDDASVGTVAWTNPSNALSSNDVRAEALAVGAATHLTHYLKVLGLSGSTIPSGAIIQGIEIQVERRGAGSLSAIATNSIKLVKGGVISGTAKGPGSGWTTSDATEAWGSASDLWGLTLTEADVNAANFGVVLQTTLTVAAASGAAQVDHIQARITYEYANAMFLTL